MESAIYVGRLTHDRRGEVRHRFSYRLYMLYLDLDELDGLELGPWFGVERAAPLSFRRRDYLGDPARPLGESVREVVRRELGASLDGPIRVLTHVRAFGYVFNPVSFYYCFDRAGALGAVVSEITNTPWGERHQYVTPAADGGAAAEFDKRFHVSPFFPMRQRYQWRFRTPGRSLGVEMVNQDGGREVFRATLALRRRPLTAGELLPVLARAPAMAATVHAAIYWQALRLWRKGVPFFAHPKHSLTEEANS